jgi:hypothetical protein
MTSAMPRGQSAVANSASPRAEAAGNPVTESNLSLCLPAQVAADLGAFLWLLDLVGAVPNDRYTWQLGALLAGRHSRVT